MTVSSSDSGNTDTPTLDDAVKAFMENLGGHDDCPWEQVGPCVYCTTHNVRLYQGTLPEGKRTTPEAPGV